MPGPHEWPSKAADARDEAAEHVNEVAVILEDMLPRVPPDSAVTIGSAAIRLQYALRILESKGAKTRPPDKKLNHAAQL